MSQDERFGSGLAQAQRKIVVTADDKYNIKVSIEGIWNGRLIVAVSRAVEKEYKMIKYNMMKKLTRERVKPILAKASKQGGDDV